MQKSKMLMWLQRHYGMRHCMVEAGYITPKQFCEEVLILMEGKGMLPPKSVVDNGQDGKMWSNEWEPEDKGKEEETT